VGAACVQRQFCYAGTCESRTAGGTKRGPESDAVEKAVGVHGNRPEMIVKMMFRGVDDIAHI
jgi:hypothetical protein